MSETQEIDALLISALYGELTPAQESALEAHFVSHPADKSALAALTSTREAVRASRILQVQLDPPQAVSALLLQEAARRAPRVEKAEGWFARIARSFMMNPAMAAAAMLVVVIGTVTLVQNRKGDQFAETEPAQAVQSKPADQSVVATAPDRAEARDRQQATGEGAQAAASAGAGSAAAANGPGASTDTGRFDDGKDSYRVALADADEAPAKQKQKLTEQIADEKKAEAPVAKNLKGGEKKAPSGGYLELRSAEPSVKELEEAGNTDAERPYATAPTDVAKDSVNAVTPGRSAGVGQAQAPQGGMADDGIAARPPRGNAAGPVASGETQATRKVDAPASRNTNGSAPAAAPAPPPPPPTNKVATTASPKTVAPAEDKSANDPQLAWAREQHTAIIARVRSGDCKGAAAIAVGLANRDLAYYKQNVASDRSVKDCLAYIDNAREKDQEQRAERAKAPQKRTTNEPAATKRAADQPTDSK